MNRSQFTNFLRPPWIIGGHFYFLMRLRAKVLDTSGISNTDLQIFQFCDWWIFFLEIVQQAVKIYQRNFTNRKNPPKFVDLSPIKFYDLVNVIQYIIRTCQRHAGKICKNYWIFLRYPICPGINRIKILKFPYKIEGALKKYKNKQRLVFRPRPINLNLKRPQKISCDSPFKTKI